MLLACSNMTLPDCGSATGACHPPCGKPPSRSSSGPPGACATPSSVTNSVTMSLPMRSSSSEAPAARCRRVASGRRGTCILEGTWPPGRCRRLAFDLLTHKLKTHLVSTQQIYRGLADPTRREILRLLREGDLP